LATITAAVHGWVAGNGLFKAKLLRQTSIKLSNKSKKEEP